MMTRISAPRFWHEKGSLYSFLLSPVAKIYGWAVRQRFDLYHPIPLAKPVICVGNIVTGGAGKTPVVLSLVDLMLDRGYNPHLLTRGYGGSEKGPLQVAPNRDTAEDVGDEALLLVEKAPTWVSRSRALGAQEAIDTGASVIIMDDGFQNPSFYKDFSLVVIDGGAGFGNGHVIPAGPLREEIPFALSRADAVVIIGDDRQNAAAEIAQHNENLPVFYASLKPDAGNPDLFGKTVFAFAGIGRPEKFRDSLIAAGAMLEGWGSYPDHFAYVEDDLKELVAAAEARGALIVTTAKDHVRLPPSLRDRVQKFSVHLAWQDPSGLCDLIERALRKNFSY